MLDGIIIPLLLFPACSRPEPRQDLALFLRMYMDLQLSDLFPLPHDRFPHIRLDCMTLEDGHRRRDSDRQIKTRQSPGLYASDVSDFKKVAAVDERLDDPFEARTVVVGDSLV
jgi:hypothetical protein